MSDAPSAARFDAVSAKVTALVMLVEALYVDMLSKESNPKRFGDEIVKSIMDAENKALEIAQNDYAFRISAEASGLIDRAVKRALSHR